LPLKNKKLERIAKRGIKIKQNAARKKADPQAVQRGRLFRAALFARYSFSFVFTACACSASVASRLVYYKRTP